MAGGFSGDAPGARADSTGRAPGCSRRRLPGSTHDGCPRFLRLAVVARGAAALRSPAAASAVREPAAASRRVILIGVSRGQSTVTVWAASPVASGAATTRVWSPVVSSLTVAPWPSLVIVTPGSTR